MICVDTTVKIKRSSLYKGSVPMTLSKTIQYQIMMDKFEYHYAMRMK